MALDETIGVRSITKRRRLQVGQGVPGGGRGLPNLPDGASSLQRTRKLPLSQAARRTTPQPTLGSPAGFALSLDRPAASNRPLHAQPEYAGAAVLRRGSFLQHLPPAGSSRDTELSDSDHRILKLLDNPDQYFNPRKNKELQLIVRPGPGLAAAIESDPKLMKNRQELLQHLAISTKTRLPAQSLVAALERQVGTGKMSFAEFSRKYDKQLSKLSPEEQQRFARRVNEVEDRFDSIEAAGVLASVGTGVGEDSFLGNLAKDWASLVTGIVPGTVQAVRHPVKTGKAVAEGYAQTYGPLVHGDIGKFGAQFQDHPLGPMMDALAVASVGIGTAGRIGAASAAADASKTISGVAGTMSRVGRRTVAEKPGVMTERLAATAEDLGHSDLASMLRNQRFKSNDDIEVFLKEGGDEAKPILETFHKAPKSRDVTTVGDQFTVTPSSTGTWEVRRNGKFVAINMPTEKAAIEHAQQVATGLSGEELKKLSSATRSTRLKAGAHGYFHPEQYGKTRGALIDYYENLRGEQHTKELEMIADEVGDVLEDPNLKLRRRTVQEVVAQTKADVRSAYEKYKQGPERLRHEDPQMMKGRVLPKATTAVGQTYKETMALVRMGAIYLRPAYIPNNWAGNSFMNLVHQGPLAPINLAKTFAVSKHMKPRNRVAMQRAMGEHAAGAVYHGSEGSILAAAGSPLVQTMGRVADIPFREAAFLHEARRLGYRKLSSVDKLFDQAAAGNEAALNTIAKIGRRGQEEIVKFGRLSHVEKSVAQNILFVYNWVRGAARYGMRLPMQHPIQAAAGAAVSKVGNEWVEDEMGGLPWFLLGSIPVGHDKQGNPIIINPFALNPLGTLADITRAAVGTAKVLTGEPGAFNKFSDTDVADLTHPLIQEYLRAREGSSRGFGREIAESIAPVKLAQRLQHPDSGGIFPYNREEAVGAYVVGSLFPRRVSQEGISKALEREMRGNPVKLIPRQIREYEKATGEKVDPKFIGQLKGDVEALQEMKKFKRSYANDHGGHGFENLPPRNQLEASVIFSQQHGFMSNEEADQLLAEIERGGLDDATMNEVANSIWSGTGIGQVVRLWHDQIKAVKGQKTTKAKR